MLFLNVTAGILFISNAVPIMRELTGASPATALGIYGFIALFNGVGRFFWGAVSDRIGRNWAYILIYGSQVLIFFFVGGSTRCPWWRPCSRWCSSATAAASGPCRRSPPTTSARSTWA